jgi:hypothetical protein
MKAINNEHERPPISTIIYLLIYLTRGVLNEAFQPISFYSIKCLDDK